MHPDHTTEGIPTKQCKGCGLIKPLTDYSPSNLTNDGREGKCRKCRTRQRKAERPPALPNGQKRCNQCKQVKPATLQYFGEHKARRDGFNSTCKKCRAEKQAQLRNVYQAPDDLSCIPTRRCPKCLIEYPRTPEYFYRNHIVADGLGAYCKECDTTSALQFNTGEKARARKTRWRHKNPNYNREYVRAHAKEINEYNKRYRAQYPDKQLRYALNYRIKNPLVGRAIKARARARNLMLAANFTASDWQTAIDYFGGCCAVCGRPPGLFHTLAMDHWVPLSAPDCPGTVPGNMIPLCHGADGCNNSKGSKDAAEWLISKYGPRKAAEILARIEAYFATTRVT